MLTIHCECSKCHGTGKYKNETCPICSGTGTVISSEYINDAPIQEKLDQILRLLKGSTKKPKE